MLHSSSSFHVFSYTRECMCTIVCFVFLSFNALFPRNKYRLRVTILRMKSNCIYLSIECSKKTVECSRLYANGMRTGKSRFFKFSRSCTILNNSLWTQNHNQRSASAWINPIYLHIEWWTFAMLSNCQIGMFAIYD